MDQVLLVLILDKSTRPRALEKPFPGGIQGWYNLVE